MKRSLTRFCMMIFTLALLFNFPSFIYATEETTEQITVEQAGRVAIAFISHEIQNNPYSEWNSNTRLSKIVPIFNFEDELTAYSFELITDSKPTGYVIIAGSINTKLIKEYSNSANPVYMTIQNDSPQSIESLQPDGRISGKQKIYSSGGLEYYMQDNDLIRSIDQKTVSVAQLSTLVDKSQTKKTSITDNTVIQGNIELINELEKMEDFNLEDWFLGYNGQVSGQSGYGGIYDPFSYLQDRYGTGYSIKNMKTLSWITPHLQSDFESNANNCTLSVITTIFEYYRAIGYTKINSNTQSLYNDIRAIAVNHGYTPSGGTSPTAMDNIVKDAWKKYNYTGTGSNQYVWGFGTFTGEIDADRPVMFNLTSGYYSSHSITVRGYLEYEKGIFYSNLHFLRVYDNWTTSDRYVDYDVLAANSFGSVTLIRP